MATLTAALAALERHVGFPSTRSRQIARRLQEEHLLSFGAPGTAPPIDHLGFVTLLLAVAADGAVHAAPAAATTLLATTPGGVSLEGAPISIGTARSQLLALVETALEFPSDPPGYKIEVVANWPEIAIHQFGKVVGRFQPVGTLPDYWQARGHRKSTTIDGSAFGDAVRSTFKGNS